MKKYKTPILYSVAILIIILMHSILLDKLPRGLNVDEVGSAYDAYSLLHFGVDRWLKSWPVYFINYVDGQNALYAYLLIPVFFFFGTSTYAIRSVIAVSALVMAVFGAKTIKLLYDNKNSECAFLFLYAVMPVFTITLRFGLESHLMMSVGAIVIYYLIKSAKNGRLSSYLLFGFFSGLTLYTYAIAYLIIPIFMFLSLIYLIVKKSISVKKFIAAAVPFALLAFPLFMVQLINKYDLPEMYIGPFTLTKMRGYRISELMTDGFFKKIFAGIKSTFLYDDLKYNSIPKFGNFYYISIPFLIIGIVYCAISLYKSLKKGNPVSLYAFPLFYWISCVLVSGFMANAIGYTNITRLNGVLSSLILFIFIGLDSCIRFLKTKKAQQIAISIITVCYGVLFSFFVKFYFTEFDEFAYPYKWLFFERYDDEIFEYLDDPNNGYTDNYVFLPWLYTYYLWETKADPYKTNLTDLLADDTNVYQIGRYRMDSGIDFSSEYVFYKYGYTEENMELFRSLHFNEYETEHYITFLDPLHGREFYTENNLLGTTAKGDVVLTKSYVSLTENMQLAFYGWIDIPTDLGQTIKVSLDTERSIIDGEILADSINEKRTVCYQFVMDIDEFFGYEEMFFHVEAMDENGNSVYSFDTDMTR